MTSVSPTPKDTEAERALRELVRLKDIKERLALATDWSGAKALARDYEENQPKAWAAARAVLAASPAVTAAEDETSGKGAQVHSFRHALGQPPWRCRDCDAPYNHRIHGKPGPAPAVPEAQDGREARWMAAFIDADNGRGRDIAARLMALADEEIAAAEDEREVMEALQQRDDAEEWADRLAYAIEASTGVAIGEHSNVNNPWQNALDALPASPAVTPVVHRCPVEGSGVTPCCGKTPFELPATDRLAVVDSAATCAGPPAVTEGEREWEWECPYPMCSCAMGATPTCRGFRRSAPPAVTAAEDETC